LLCKGTKKALSNFQASIAVGTHFSASTDEVLFAIAQSGAEKAGSPFCFAHEVYTFECKRNAGWYV
jgi:hypothetical protein